MGGATGILASSIVSVTAIPQRHTRDRYCRLPEELKPVGIAVIGTAVAFGVLGVALAQIRRPRLARVVIEMKIAMLDQPTDDTACRCEARKSLVHRTDRFHVDAERMGAAPMFIHGLFEDHGIGRAVRIILEAVGASIPDERRVPEMNETSAQCYMPRARRCRCESLPTLPGR